VLALVGCSNVVNSSSVPNAALTIQASGPTTVLFGGSTQLKAYLWNAPYASVNWSLDPATPVGTVTEDGLYVAPSKDGPPGTQVKVTVYDRNSTATTSAMLTLVAGAAPTLTSATPGALVPGVATQITLSGTGLSTVSSVTVNNQSVAVSPQSDNRVSFAYTALPWATGNISVQGVSSNPAIAASNALSIPLTQPAISYDAASRFLEQAAWAPTVGAVQQVQAKGFSAYIDQQLASGPDYFNTDGDTGHVAFAIFLNGVTHDASQLRTKMAWIWWKLFCTPGSSVAWVLSSVPDQINRDAFGNFETLFADVTLNPQMGAFLTYDILDYPGHNPNQNFGRESMQLYSLGPVLLNPDGTAQLDGSGKELPAYSQADVIAISRAVTGFVYPDNYRLLGDPHGEKQLQSSTTFPHDEEPKTVLGVTLPSNRSVTQDTKAVIHILASHPNVGPFMGSYLIHELVTSNPSLAYVARVTAAWNDNGHGVRGDIPTVIKAVLLDPEARAGDDPAQIPETEGRFRDPAQVTNFTYRTLQNWQGQSAAYASGYTSTSQEAIWTAADVFGFYQQTTTLPNTNLRAPESQLYTTTSIQAHAWWLYNMIYVPGGVGILQSNFDWTYWGGLASGDGSALIDFINHHALHGTMSDGLRSFLQQDVQQQSDLTLRAQKMLFDAYLSPEMTIQR
jgi:uncharacterized protein (DUF1800 family)